MMLVSAAWGLYPSAPLVEVVVRGSFQGRPVTWKERRISDGSLMNMEVAEWGWRRRGVAVPFLLVGNDWRSCLKANRGPSTEESGRTEGAFKEGGERRGEEDVGLKGAISSLTEVVVKGVRVLVEEGGTAQMG